MNSNYEQYNQPRTVAINGAAAVPGYVAIRLTPRLTQTAGTQADANTQLILKNHAYEGMTTPSGTLTFQLKQTSDSSPSGSRTNLGSAVTLPAGGHTVVNFTPTQPYVEVWCTASSNSKPGVVRAELTGRVVYGIESFTKTDTNYPTSLWKDTNTTF